MRIVGWVLCWCALSCGGTVQAAASGAAALAQAAQRQAGDLVHPRFVVDHQHVVGRAGRRGGFVVVFKKIGVIHFDHLVDRLC